MIIRNGVSQFLNLVTDEILVDFVGHNKNLHQDLKAGLPVRTVF